MRAEVRVTNPYTNATRIFEADTARPVHGKYGVDYGVVMDAIIRHDMWAWTNAACEDMDNKTAWARGDRPNRDWPYEEITE